MVGVGGRSKACDNCRRRRIKCDEQKPHCSRCMKAKLSCGGYPEVTIIQYDGRRRQKASSSSSSSSSSPAIPSESEAVSNDASNRKIVARPGVRIVPKLTEAKFAMVPQMPFDFDEVFIEYTRDRLLRGPNVTAIELPLNVDRTLMIKAFLALSTTYYGIEHKDRRIVNQGMQRYSHALEHVHRALSDASRNTSFDVLESIGVMSLFEFLISDRQDGWLSHSLGLEKLLILRGPESFTTMPELQIFENSRTPIIFASLILRRHTVLSNPEWKIIPWMNYLERKTSTQRLIDFLADCPALFIDRDRLFSDQCAAIEKTTGMIDVLNRAHDLLQQMEFWEKQWDREHPGYCYEVSTRLSIPNLTNPNYEEDDVPAWSTVLDYVTLDHANTMVVYNGALILLLNLVQSILQKGDLPVSDNNMSTYLPKKMTTAGLNICRSVEYHLQSLRQGAGSFYLLFPLRMAYDAVGRDNREIGFWIQDILKQIQDGKTGRWAAAKYLLNLGK